MARIDLSRIEWIKEYRARTGCDLRSAVEAWKSNAAMPAPLNPGALLDLVKALAGMVAQVEALNAQGAFEVVRERIPWSVVEAAILASKKE